MKRITGCMAGCLTVAVATLVGCRAVGPDHRAPELADDAALEQALAVARGATNGVTASVQQLAGWWNRFNDPVLTDLVGRALATNRTLAVAELKIREARARLGIARAPLLPGVDARAGYRRYGQSQNAMVVPMGNIDENNFQTGFDAVWELDLFGGVRRQVEAAESGWQATIAARDQVWVSLAAEVAQTYVSYRTTRQRLVVARENLALQQATLEIIESRFSSGIGSELPVHQARYNLENTRAQIPSLEASCEELANTLSVLVGELPGGWGELLAAEQAIPSADRLMLAGIPAEQIRLRPDVRQAERQVAVQSAKIGVATADLYPKFRLNGSIGLESLEAKDLFDGGKSLAYSLGPQISWAIFRGGSIRKAIVAQTAIQEQAVANYEQTVLGAVKEVRDALVAYEKEYARHAALTAAVDAARKAESLSEDLYKNGLTDFNNVLDAQRSLLALQEQETFSRGRIATELIRVYKALGGGWSPIPEVKPVADAPKS